MFVNQTTLMLIMKIVKTIQARKTKTTKKMIMKKNQTLEKETTMMMIMKMEKATLAKVIQA